jgi:hypothetical protein
MRALYSLKGKSPHLAFRGQETQDEAKRRESQALNFAPELSIGRSFDNMSGIRQESRIRVTVPTKNFRHPERSEGRLYFA